MAPESTPTTRIKICGLRSAEASVVASDAGADYLGFNFVEGVRRRLQPEEGVQVITDYRANRKSSNRSAIFGLFRNQDPDFVNKIGRNAGLDYIQLAGDEDDQYISKIELPVFKQLWVKEGMTSPDLDTIVSPLLVAGHGVLLDSYNRGTLGGSGKKFDWASAENIANRDNVLLAGGLNPENVQSAITQLSPWGVDVASGVETDGVKDPDRIRAFIEAVRST
ncbi:MAG TPA: phosphoribosylanthranilate isomerase [Dehalococcoidia bacterium]|mgnify:CR=1 FL=1|jgi:phosphoribosylanthranilate isomerase|nr:N-(5'-phosphoribosyl)anthranilate isomerase [Chloroflexota bacterium]MDP6055209.1 phosphoribosylanthranilate isomerase [Dehalococcoidia bacterium]MDP7262885.1 phosphoribosylanthranilate isomerase [Dehalococcoidia bacterium]MDP7484846.1 phosphoribosylanthranilate isomerase [Dehalococcoidia bacterium]HJP28474.1 phosphoribosylanthranilate isomerase [Dehalococcoidia bacterium]|tara:strand:+ start:7992 stop:8657 length:666 start_codon:yes stop_codon:yes gene_type:complete